MSEEKVSKYHLTERVSIQTKAPSNSCVMRKTGLRASQEAKRERLQ